MSKDNKTQQTTNIENLSQQLCDNLLGQLHLHEQLIAVLEQKRECLRRADLENIFTISQQEQKIVQQLTQSEQQRRQLMQAATDTDFVSGPVQHISDLTTNLPKADGERLQSLAEQLKVKVQEARAASSIVRSAAETLSHHIGGVMQSLRKAMSDVGVYERKGQIAVGRQVTCAVDIRS